MSDARFAPVVLFDLDGTLVDSAHDLLDAINIIADREGVAALPLETIRPVVSKGARAMLAAAFPAYSAEQREILLKPFLDCYAEAVAEHATPFDGIAEVLDAIEASGSRWGIVTNKPYLLAQAVVASMGWGTRCRALIGGDTLPRKKPDPDQLFLACEQLAVEADRCVYVGDDQRDIAAAGRAGMKSVAALWGYREANDDPVRWGSDCSVAQPLGLLAPGVMLR